MFAQTLRSDLLQIIAENPVTFSFDGVEYTGTMSGKNLRVPLEIGGFQDEPELSIIIAIHDAYGNRVMNTLPAVGQKVTTGGTTYRIDRIETDVENVGLQMDLRSANK